LDVLKKLIPEKLINIDCRKVEIKNEGIIIGGQVINDPKLTKEILDQVLEHLTSKSLPYDVIHKELENGYLEYKKISIKDKESLIKLKEVLPMEDVECIMMARRVKLAYDSGDGDLAKGLLQQLKKNYPEKGSRVYCLIGGGYFEEIIIPYIEIFREKYGSDYVNKYREFYQATLRNFPIAMFVGSESTEEGIEKELSDRLNWSNLPFIRIHTIGISNIRKVDEVIKKLELNKKYNLDRNEFSNALGKSSLVLEIRTKISA
jgi:hypothetical protein